MPLVALNDDFDEKNLGQEVIVVGPDRREVQVLKPAKDNEPDRIPEQQRQHRIHVGWETPWDLWSDQPWSGWSDDEVRPAMVRAGAVGKVQFTVPEGVKLWIPAWALYGQLAFSHNPNFQQLGARWIEVSPDNTYVIEHFDSTGMTTSPAYGIPLAVEGIELSSGEIVATFVPADGREAREDSVTVHVVAVDLDIDSDNDNGLGPPDRSSREDQLEEDPREVGKRVLVNADDADHDDVPDFLDGFNLDGLAGDPAAERPGDDQVGAGDTVGFVPIVIELPPEIDVGKSLVRFHYSASDPAAATISPHGERHLAPGGLRLWTVDESVPRDPHAADDPGGAGHFVAPFAPPYGGYSDPQRSAATYSVSQLTGGVDVHRFTVYVEGVRPGSTRSASPSIRTVFPAW